MVLHLHAGRLSAALALGALAACTEAPAVVDNAAPAWGDSVAWRIGAEPALIAGRAPEDLDALLSAVDAARTSHGRIAVSVQALDQLRIYDPAGSLVATAGGPGSGVFHAIGQVWVRPGDIVAVASIRGPEVHYFDTDGRLLGSVRLEANANTLFITPAAQFDDGSILARSLVPGPALPELGDVLRDTLAFLRFSPDGARIRSVYRIAGPRQVVFDDGGGKRQIAAPFPLTASAAAAGDDLVAGNGEAAEFAVVGSDGRTRRIVRWNATPVRVTDEVRLRYRVSAIGDAPSDQVAGIFDSFTRQAGFPDAMPVYNGIAVDDVGCIWLHAYAPPWALDDPEIWIVFDPAGRWLGSLELPPNFRATRFANAFILGLLDSPAGYRQIALFTLDRTPAQRAVPPGGAAPDSASHPPA